MMRFSAVHRWFAPALLMLAAGTGATAQQPEAAPPARPTTKIEPANCVTSQCHTGVKKHKMLHGPVNVNACDACHTAVDVTRHTFKLARKDEKLCTFCHQLELSARVVHKPLKTGQCINCHDPHGGFDRFSLRSQTMGQLCASCHQDITQNKKVKHGPVAAGACGACHAPHQADNENLLLFTGRDLCFSCHQEMKQQLQATKFKHEPVEKDCQQCHDPHASDHLMMLHQSPMTICTAACHEQKKQEVTSATYKHSAVTKDAACVNCHTAHGGSLDHLMVDKPIHICMKCHDKPVKIDERRTVPAMTELTDPKLVKHGMIEQGSCGGCHNVHGSEVSRLLAKHYPETFYASFALEKYDLCFSCHDKQLVLLPRTEGLTGFRNGDLNLHYLHVNKAKRGRTCRACHATHASKRKVHVRETVPYGNWQLPINYTPTKNGGTCAPGCHQKLSYDRNYVPPPPDTNPPDGRGDTPPGQPDRANEPAPGPAPPSPPSTPSRQPAALVPERATGRPEPVRETLDKDWQS